nr:hypothetical protein [Angustibacter aerolatus]
MRIDHVSYAAEIGGLRDTAERLAEQARRDARPRRCAPPLRHPQRRAPAARPALPRGRRVPRPPGVRQGAVRSGREAAQRGRRGLARVGRRGRRPRPLRAAPRSRGGTGQPAPSRRHRACAGARLGIRGLISDPRLPYFTRWEVDDALHPSQDGPTEAGLKGLTIAGDPQRVWDWLGLPEDEQHETMFAFVSPKGTPA